MNCPECGYHFDSHASIGRKAEPKSDDRSICIECGAIAIYQYTPFGLTLRKPTAEELEVSLNDPMIQQVLESWRTVKAGRAKGEAER